MTETAQHPERRDPQVESFLGELEHPFVPQILALREIVLGASPAIEERIKWKSPSFYSSAHDLGAFELRPRDFVRLVFVFPRGMVDDPEGIMQGSWADRRELRFTSHDEIQNKRVALETIVRDWVALLAP